MKISIPTFYDKAKPPKLTKKLGTSNPLNFQVIIKNIDFVNTISMTVGLTIELHVTWKDSQLTYFNLIQTEGGLNDSVGVDSDLFEKLWLPIPVIEHDNAVIGKTKEDRNKYVLLQPLNKPIPMDPELHRENLCFPGSENDLVMIQKFKLEYLCNFNLQKFPFDHQECSFLMKIRVANNMSIMFMPVADAVVYSGSKELAEFRINEISHNARLKSKETSFTYSISFQRMYISHLSSTYFQTFLMWFLAYLMLFIRIEDFSNRFMGTVTALLVLVALLSSIADKLPQTSYFKFIDIWFTFYIINIIFLIMFAIFVDSVLTQNDQLVMFCQSGIKPDTKRKQALRYNNYAKILFPLIVGLFSLLYFALSTI